MREIQITEITGLLVGHAHNMRAGTGCTVVITAEGATAGVDVRGGAPGTRETDLLNPVNMVEQIHAVLLAGGSAFGLDAAAGIMQYLEERKIGFNVQLTNVPIVCGAVLFDLFAGDYKIRPDREMGYQACLNAEKKELLQGSVGAGTGATIGKVLGHGNAMKGGFGSYFLQTGDLQVGAMVAVNCFGEVIDPVSRKIIAGVLSEDKKSLLRTEQMMLKQGNNNDQSALNTTIGVLFTNATLTKAQAQKIAGIAHNGYARTIQPAHTMVDGDTIFTMATGQVEADLNLIGLLAVKVVEKAVIRAIKAADSRYGFKSYSDLNL